VLDYGGEFGRLSLVASHREDKTLTRERVTMKLAEVETLKDLNLWVKENMPGATLVENENGIVINTGLASSMGGYLNPIERESE
jgi:hypothetical protein